MVNSSVSIQQELSEHIQQSKLEGTLQPDRLREIIRSTALRAAADFRGGSLEVYALTKELMTQMVELLQDRPQDLQENLVAVIEGMIEGFSWGKREAIAGFQTQIERLQTQTDHQERALQDQTDQILNTVELVVKHSDNHAQTALKAAVDTLRTTEAMTTMRQRYPQLRLQLAILKANLIAGYGEHYHEIKKHLEEAKFWYKEVQDQSSHALQEKTPGLEHHQTEFEKTLEQIEAALAHKERQVQQLLAELWHRVADQD